MAESYCLKSCDACGREGCAGCRNGAYADRCEIVKCCREKNHDSCESCTRVSYCPTRANRDLMPRRVMDLERRAAELAVRKRADAEVLAKWTKFVFWCLIATNVTSLLGFLGDLSSAVGWIDLIGSGVLVLAVSYGMYQMKRVDPRFQTVAIWQAASHIAYSLHSVLALEENGFATLLTLVFGAVGIYVTKTKTETFRDSLCGISGELAVKWENQWKLYKISLYLLLGGLAATLVLTLLGPLSVLGLLAMLGGVGVLLFVDIREYVYLWQTTAACEAFSEGSGNKTVDSPAESW